MNTVEIQTLISKARDAASRGPRSPSSAIVEELCAALEHLAAAQTDLRKEAFRDAVRGLGNAVRYGKIPASTPWASDIPGDYVSEERLAQEIEASAASTPIGLPELRQLRQMLKAVSEGNDEIDRLIKRIYYSSIYETGPSLDLLLPPGSPSRSLDFAALVVQRVVPNGWWTLGSNGDNLSEQPVAKVGTWTGDNPKPESSINTPLTLLAAMTLTLIESAKKVGE